MEVILVKLCVSRLLRTFVAYEIHLVMISHDSRIAKRIILGVMKTFQYKSLCIWIVAWQQAESSELFLKILGAL